MTFTVMPTHLNQQNVPTSSINRITWEQMYKTVGTSRPISPTENPINIQTCMNCPSGQQDPWSHFPFSTSQLYCTAMPRNVILIPFSSPTHLGTPLAHSLLLIAVKRQIVSCSIWIRWSRGEFCGEKPHREMSVLHWHLARSLLEREKMG